jgi:polyhydroxyalkanoate synthesis regulator phasin
VIAEIERLELDARMLRRRIEHVTDAVDRKVLDRQMVELRGQIERLRERLIPRPARIVP